MYVGHLPTKDYKYFRSKNGDLTICSMPAPRYEPGATCPMC